MAKIGHVPEIIEIKEHLKELKTKGIIKDWALPYENLLTRLTAAVFFVEPVGEKQTSELLKGLSNRPDTRFEFQSRENKEKKLSQLKLRLEFTKKDGSM